MNSTMVKLREWIGQDVYTGREIEKRIYDMSLNEIPTTAIQNNRVAVWDLEPGKYMLLYIEYPTLISPLFEYSIMCLDVGTVGVDVSRIEKHFIARVSLSKNIDQELRKNIILTLLRQLQSLC